MKLARKFTISLLLGVTLVFGLEAYLQTTRDLEHFERDTRIDQGLVAQAFRAAAETTWRLQGPREARRLVEELDRTEPSVKLRWVSRRARLVAAADSRFDYRCVPRHPNERWPDAGIDPDRRRRPELL